MRASAIRRARVSRRDRAAVRPDNPEQRRVNRAAAQPAIPPRTAPAAAIAESLPSAHHPCSRERGWLRLNAIDRTPSVVRGRSCMPVRSAVFLVPFLCAVSASAHGDVRQCIDAAGSMLLTDAACPSGYRAVLVIDVPAPSVTAPVVQLPTPGPGQPSSEKAPSNEGTHALELERLEAENSQLRASLAAQRLDRIEQRLDALAVWPEVHSFGVLPLPQRSVRGHHCDGERRCDVSRVHRPPRPVERADGGCGTFGCTPSLTRSQWDRERDFFDARSRPAGTGHAPREHTAPPRRTNR